jgi:hypothetical protein
MMAPLFVSFRYREALLTTRIAQALSTTNTKCSLIFRNRCSHHNNAMQIPQSRPNRDGECARDPTQSESQKQGWGMTEQQDRLAREREEIAARIARFRETQEKFEREREEYFVTTLEKAKRTKRPPFSTWRT